MSPKVFQVSLAVAVVAGSFAAGFGTGSVINTPQTTAEPPPSPSVAMPAQSWPICRFLFIPTPDLPQKAVINQTEPDGSFLGVWRFPSREQANLARQTVEKALEDVKKEAQP